MPAAPAARSAILPVGIAPAQRGDIALYVEGLGTVAPLHTVTVRTQISGQLTQLSFQEGQFVRQGDLLAVIDSRPYENALTQAGGELRQAEAQLKKAQLDLDRYQKLAQEDSIAKQQVDTAQAQVTQFEGLVQTSQAAIDSAKLNIAYCHIAAPVAGRVGLRKVDVGNYVTPGDANGIVVLTQMKPSTVLFTLPEDNLALIVARLRAGVKLAVDAFDRAQSHRLATGTLATIDNQFDPTTGTFKLRAAFANDDESLFPNQFVNEPVLILAALVAIYVVLGVLYESYTHPVTILSTLPSAGLGAVLALLLFKTEFSLIALIGVFLLIGIVKKNAIMMIDFAIAAERHEGLAPREAIFRAALLRFRPILMTTISAILSALPLALGVGDGAELRQPLGIAIVGGLLVSQLLTLYTTPVVYLAIDHLRLWMLRRRGGIAHAENPAANLPAEA